MKIGRGKMEECVEALREVGDFVVVEALADEAGHGDDADDVAVVSVQRSPLHGCGEASRIERGRNGRDGRARGVDFGGGLWQYVGVRRGVALRVIPLAHLHGSGVFRAVARGLVVRKGDEADFLQIRPVDVAMMRSQR